MGNKIRSLGDVSRRRTSPIRSRYLGMRRQTPRIDARHLAGVPMWKLVLDDDGEPLMLGRKKAGRHLVAGKQQKTQNELRVPTICRLPLESTGMTQDGNLLETSGSLQFPVAVSKKVGKAKVWVQGRCPSQPGGGNKVGMAVFALPKNLHQRSGLTALLNLRTGLSAGADKAISRDRSRISRGLSESQSAIRTNQTRGNSISPTKKKKRLRFASAHEFLAWKSAPQGEGGRNPRARVRKGLTEGLGSDRFQSPNPKAD